jgi:hypothetical protein
MRHEDGFRRGNLFLVFLGLPQGRHIVHRFCTRGEVFCVARRNKVAESGFSENVRVPDLAE